MLDELLELAVGANRSQPGQEVLDVLDLALEELAVLRSRRTETISVTSVSRSSWSVSSSSVRPCPCP